MSAYKKYHIYSAIIVVLFTFFLLYSGYFSIGLTSDDYLNFYDANNSTLLEKVTGKLPFTNALHVRPVYYLSIEKSYVISQWLGLDYDNFSYYRVQNLVLLLLISYIAGRIILYLSGRYKIALTASASILIFPNNLNNICWTAARVDLLVGLFMVTVIYFILRYIVFEDLISFIMIYASYVLALFTKESAFVLPFVALMFIYFVYGKKVVLRHKLHFISMFILLFLLIIYRVFLLKSNFLDILTLYQSNPFSNAPGVIARSIIGLSIPLDFLTLNRMLKQNNKIILLYLASIYGAGFYLIWTMFKIDVYKYIMQLLALGLVLISPYIIIGYIRPQMILIPFVILMIFTLWVYNKNVRKNKFVNKKILYLFYLTVLVFWVSWCYSTISDWKLSYSKAIENVSGLINTNLDVSKQNIIIGSPGRYKQTFLFDKMTGAYNFWKEKSFSIKLILNDIIQTGTLDESSIGAKLDLKQLSSHEFEIKTTGKSQFFYIEGYNIEKIKTGFRNNDISVEFTEFNYLDKPIKLKLTILSENVNCYLASEFKFIKIF